MSDTANAVFQWIGVGVALAICLIYIVKKLSKKGNNRGGMDASGCEGCPLANDCTKRSCGDKPKNHSSGSCCH